MRARLPPVLFSTCSRGMANRLKSSAIPSAGSQMRSSNGKAAMEEAVVRPVRSGSLIFFMNCSGLTFIQPARFRLVVIKSRTAMLIQPNSMLLICSMLDRSLVRRMLHRLRKIMIGSSRQIAFRMLMQLEFVMCMIWMSGCISL